jgi:hypothetical protein
MISDYAYVLPCANARHLLDIHEGETIVSVCVCSSINDVDHGGSIIIPLLQYQHSATVVIACFKSFI